MFPFSGLSVHQFFDYITLKNSLNENPKQTNKQTGNKKLICSVCYKSNSLNKGLKYFSCDSPDYKKSAELNQCDFLFDKIIQNTYWNTLHVKMQIFHLHILVLMKYNVQPLTPILTANVKQQCLIWFETILLSVLVQ